MCLLFLMYRKYLMYLSHQGAMYLMCLKNLVPRLLLMFRMYLLCLLFRMYHLFLLFLMYQRCL